MLLSRDARVCMAGLCYTRSADVGLIVRDADDSLSYRTVT